MASRQHGCKVARGNSLQSGTEPHDLFLALDREASEPKNAIASISNQRPLRNPLVQESVRGPRHFFPLGFEQPVWNASLWSLPFPLNPTRANFRIRGTRRKELALPVVHVVTATEVSSRNTREKSSKEMCVNWGAACNLAEPPKHLAPGRFKPLIDPLCITICSVRPPANSSPIFAVFGVAFPAATSRWTALQHVFPTPFCSITHLDCLAATSPIYF